MPVRIFLAFSLGHIILNAQIKPADINTSRWVREDLFAGMLANDSQRLDLAMRKLEKLLETAPNDPAAIVWRGLGELTAAVRAHEASHVSEYSRLSAQAIQSFADADRISRQHAGVRSVIAVSWSGLGDRLPASDRAKAFESAYTMWSYVLQASQKRVAQISEHGRGEMYAALAFSAQRSGRLKESQAILREMESSLVGTTFAKRAARWLEQPRLLQNASSSCQSCHEPGRLH